MTRAAVRHAAQITSRDRWEVAQEAAAYAKGRSPADLVQIRNCETQETMSRAAGWQDGLGQKPLKYLGGWIRLTHG